MSLPDDSEVEPPKPIDGSDSGATPPLSILPHGHGSPGLHGMPGGIRLAPLSMNTLEETRLAVEAKVAAEERRAWEKNMEVCLLSLFALNYCLPSTDKPLHRRKLRRCITCCG